MEDLQSLRAKIDQIDRQIAQLFCQRMAVTRQVGEYKAAHGLPVLDVAREKQVLAAMVKYGYLEQSETDSLLWDAAADPVLAR